MNRSLRKARVAVPILIFLGVLAITPKFWAHFEIVTTGWMTGGGSIIAGDSPTELVPAATRITHGFQLNCDRERESNSLQVNIHKDEGEDGNFHLEELTFAECRDQRADSGRDPRPPKHTDFDVYWGKGVGRYNGDAGFCAEWVFTDAGEPGRDDTISNLYVWNCESGEFVVRINAPGYPLEGGNHQAHSKGRP